VLSVALLGALGRALPEAARVLATLAGLASFWALKRFWDELSPRQPWGVLLPAVLLGTSAPFAAWIFGGLETPLFVCLYTLSLALIAGAARVPSPRRAALAGLASAACTLCRPEGAVLVLLGSVVLCGRDWRRTLAWLGPVSALVGGYELFRLRYYGYPLPNTFYVKTSGSGLWDRGVQYLQLAGSEFSWPIVVACGVLWLSLLVPNRARERFRAQGGSLRLAWLAALACTVQLAYVARVGGDFLDLYRFLTPLLPAAFCVLSAGLWALFEATRTKARWLVAVSVLGLLVLHGVSQRSLALDATAVSAESRRALRLEPLGWTRLYGLRWRGLGEWLASVRLPGDSTAVGAAGALPFYSGLPNLDLFGLNDLDIARNGRVIGNRPGHQRFATMDYLLAAQPTFLFLNPELTPLTPTRLRTDRYWSSRGYVPIEIRVDAARCGCPETFYHQFLVRRERANRLRGREDTVVGAP